MNTIETLKVNADVIRSRYPVSKIGVFGSVARGKETETSDVDVLVEFAEPVDIFEFIDFKEFLENLLGKTVDLVSVKALKPFLKDKILSEVVYV
ncbi:nucleotidyltransferase family protein [Candidatus Magnetobacterium casense]|uniref:nucleotidyltransferase family protein n=1 Tax=Candidatus Magnetobacterium casense TaxID=1455061 RepID=UPI0005910C1B|nr:nucleotidyltransferase family protein [Candidatus Magnetobacterium casensis]